MSITIKGKMPPICGYVINKTTALKIAVAELAEGRPSWNETLRINCCEGFGPGIHFDQSDMESVYQLAAFYVGKAGLINLPRLRKELGVSQEDFPENKDWKLKENLKSFQETRR